MEEQVTLSQLKEQYPDEWVLIGDPSEFKGEVKGVLIMHNRNKSELARQFSQIAHSFSNTILRYTGKKPLTGKWLRFTPLH